MRLPRMTTRRWMAAVAVVAIAFGAEMTRRRSVSYRGKANGYALKRPRLRTAARTYDQITAERKKHLREVEAYAEGYGGRFRADWKPLIDPTTQSATLASEKAENCHRGLPILVP